MRQDAQPRGRDGRRDGTQLVRHSERRPHSHELNSYDPTSREPPLLDMGFETID